jgi:hypothetical protein
MVEMIVFFVGWNTEEIQLLGQEQEINIHQKDIIVEQ